MKKHSKNPYRLKSGVTDRQLAKLGYIALVPVLRSATFRISPLSETLVSIYAPRNRLLHACPLRREYLEPVSAENLEEAVEKLRDALQRLLHAESYDLPYARLQAEQVLEQTKEVSS